MASDAVLGYGFESEGGYDLPRTRCGQNAKTDITYLISDYIIVVVVNEALTYEADERVSPNPDDQRLDVFKEGWRKANRGEEYGEHAHSKLSWHNLGWRLGKLFGETSDELKDEMYMWCVKQQREGSNS